MAISAKMLAVLQKVDAAREAHFAELRARGAADRARLAKAKTAHVAKKKPKKS
jgi:hypothetical protein